MRLRAVVVLALAALALPAQAAAHGRAATVALDFKLVLDRSTQHLPGVRVRILDGDRDFQVKVAPGVHLVVRGAIGEEMLRVGPTGVWANAGSPTALIDLIVPSTKHGWVHISNSRTYAWHDHRLAPPPASKPGFAGEFVVGIDIDGKPASITGSFIRVPRPSTWPWPLGALLAAGGILLAIRRRPLRAPLTVAIGTASGVAALLEVTTFAVRDATTGGVAWLNIGTAIVVAVILLALLVRLRGRARVHAAGVVGAVATAVSLESLAIFWHGNVISALPGTLARIVCEVAVVGGVAAAALSFLPDFDEPVRGRARSAARQVRPIPAKRLPR